MRMRQEIWTAGLLDHFSMRRFNLHRWLTFSCFDQGDNEWSRWQLLLIHDIELDSRAKMRLMGPRQSLVPLQAVFQ
jgi:hypothetical protein